MNEFKTKETPEIKLPESQGFKEIKPQSDINPSDAKQYWNELFEQDGSESNNAEASHPEFQQPDDRQSYDVHMLGTEGHQYWDKTFESNHDEIGKEGGSYSEVKKYSDGQTHEVHHMPADSASPLDRMDGPAIKMEKEDHRQTASCGSSLEAREYQAEQREKIQNGDFRGALQMDIDDIREKFGDKYDAAIDQMLEYVDKLEAEGKI